MIIYEFKLSYIKNKPFNVTEIEVEEKQKIYVGKYSRIRKDEIGKFSTSYGNKMYLLENNPEIYINAMIEFCKNGVKVAEARLADAQEKLSKWSALAEQKGKNDVQKD